MVKSFEYASVHLCVNFRGGPQRITGHSSECIFGTQQHHPQHFVQASQAEERIANGPHRFMALPLIFQGGNEAIFGMF